MQKSDCDAKPSSLRKKKLDLQWDKKWRNMIHQKAIKEEMNKQLKATLERQRQEEEEKECTFKPQTLWNQNFRKTISFVDEFFVKLQPYIEQQQAYLNQMKELEYEDQLFAQKVKEELRMMLSKALDKEIMETIIEGYKGVRTRGMNKVKREKLDILSKMIKLEREYNCFMARENVDKKDLEECGFDCDLALKLRNDILKDSLCPNSLRDFAKIRQEINEVLEEELQLSENKCINSAPHTEADVADSPEQRVANQQESQSESVDSSVDRYVQTKQMRRSNPSRSPPRPRESERAMFHPHGSTDFERCDAHTLKYMDTNSSEMDSASRPTAQSSFHYQTYNSIPSKEFQRTFNKYSEAVNTNESHGPYRDREIRQKTNYSQETAEPWKQHQSNQSNHRTQPNQSNHRSQPNQSNHRSQPSQMSQLGQPNRGGHEEAAAHKGIYLNSNYLKALSNDGANNSASTLKRDSRPLNLHIVGDESKRGNAATDASTIIRQSQRKQPTQTAYDSTISNPRNANAMSRMNPYNDLGGIGRVNGTARVPGNLHPRDGYPSYAASDPRSKNKHGEANDMGAAKLMTPATQSNMRRVPNEPMGAMGVKTMNHFQYANQEKSVKNTNDSKPFFNKLMDRIPLYNKLHR